MGQGRLLLGVALAALAVLSYVSARERHPAAGEKRHVDLAPDAEAALALRSAAMRAAVRGGLILADDDAPPARDLFDLSEEPLSAIPSHRLRELTPTLPRTPTPPS